MKYFVIMLLFLSFSLTGKGEFSFAPFLGKTTKTDRGIGFSTDSNGHFSIFFSSDNSFPFSPFNPSPSPNSYSKDLSYIISKYGVSGKVVPMFIQGRLVGTALCTGDRSDLMSVESVVRVEEVDGMRVQVPVGSSGYAVRDVNVYATQLGNVRTQRKN